MISAQVPQYPLFKPQLRVGQYLNLVKAREDLRRDVARMGIPLSRRIGGKLMGMLEVPGGLSGGQRKKLVVALAVAMSKDAKVIILDEPFAGIDADSMSVVLDVLGKVRCKLFLVTHDHFDAIDNALLTKPYHLHVAHRNITEFVGGHQSSRNIVGGAGGDSGSDSTDGGVSTLQAAHVIADAVVGTTLGKMATPEKRTPFLDAYVIKRHFIEGEFILPTLTIIVFGVLSGLATADYHGDGNGIVQFSSIFVYMKTFMLEYVHFGLILNYSYKRGQHLEDYGLLITKKKDALAETVVVAIVQSVPLAFLLNALLIAIAPRFWWVNSNVILVDAFYSLLIQLAYTLIPVVQPNPLITMGSFFPYIALWGGYGGYLVPREFALHNARWLTSFSATYHFACANARASNGQLQLPGSNCKQIALHLVFISPLLLFVLVCCAFVYLRDRLGTSSSFASSGNKIPSPRKLSLSRVDDVESVSSDTDT